MNIIQEIGADVHKAHPMLRSMAYNFYHYLMCRRDYLLTSEQSDLNDERRKCAFTAIVMIAMWIAKDAKPTDPLSDERVKRFDSALKKAATVKCVIDYSLRTKAFTVVTICCDSNLVPEYRVVISADQNCEITARSV
jgi:hypothetical protein